MKHAHHDATKSKILRLKRTRNPKTGKSHTWDEIGVIMGIKKQSAFYYIKDMKNVCPGCLRKLRKLK